MEEISISRNHLQEFENCCLCPRECRVNRVADEMGYCKSDAFFHVASVCIHHGEEPVISGSKGICNVFFCRCNMQCKFCQNFQISSRNKDISFYDKDLKQIFDKIKTMLDDGAQSLGFVSPTHFVPHVKFIIKSLRQAGYSPITVYNSNAYEKASVIRSLEGFIDIYLPDFKYMDDKLAVEYSDAPSYSKYAAESIREMYRQKGSTMLVNDDGYALKGLIIRHLVLPGHVDNSIRVLRYIADEISVNVHISLMAQYNPTENTKLHEPLNRRITAEEYQQIENEMARLGFSKGWIQELNSPDYYQPDFRMDHPFEG